MSESSKQKTKRKLASDLGAYQWCFQYSVFPKLDGVDQREDKVKAEQLILSELSKFREKLRKAFPDVGIFLIIRKLKISKKFIVTYTKNFQQIYITWYASKEMSYEKVIKVLDSCYGDEVNLPKGKKITDEKMESIIGTIEKEHLHNLEPYYKLQNQRFDRYSKINHSRFVNKHNVSC